MIGRVIETETCVAEGAAWLRSVEPRFGAALARTGPLPLRRRPEGFAALFDAIVSQQVSVAAGNAIRARLERAELFAPDTVARAPDEDLRACGLSRQKIRYARALAGAAIDYPALRHTPDAGVIARLTAVPGIGRWTAEIYALFSLGRADILPAGDLALQEAARMLFTLDGRPSEKGLRALAEPWAPWRGVAARLLWAYYRVAKEREGIR
jgi:DNA-3-methyladenine glycosylase II